MTSDNGGYKSASIDRTTPLTTEVIQQWKAEIRDFFYTTERKLRQVREANDLRQPSTPTQPNQIAPPTASAVATSIHEPNTEDDSLDRLQIIKRRLAAQLETSRS